MQVDEIAFQRFRLADSADYVRSVKAGLAFDPGVRKTLGAWLTTVGELNRGVLIYQREDSETPRQELREVHGGLPTLEIRREKLKPMRSFNPPKQGLDLHELRIYSFFPEKVVEFLDRLLAVLPLRERYSPNVCIWRALEGDTTRVFHLWAYESFEERNRLRSAITAETEWQEYVAKITPLIATMQSSFLQALPY